MHDDSSKGVQDSGVGLGVDDRGEVKEERDGHRVMTTTTTYTRHTAWTDDDVGGGGSSTIKELLLHCRTWILLPLEPPVQQGIEEESLSN